MRPYLFICLLLLLVSCGSSKEEKAEAGIDLALTYLSSNKCDDALEALAHQKDGKDAIYLQVLASAYGCKAQVDVVEIIDELTNFDSTKVLNEIARKDFAQTKDLTRYHYLSRAVNTLLSSTAKVSQSSREDAFGMRKGQDMGMQLLIYSVVQISKFVNYFGNTTEGKKGDRSDGVNTCFLNYENNPLFLTLLAEENACDIPNDGHPELDLTTTKGKENACHGIILVNNALDIIDTIEFGNSENLRVLKDISLKISALRSFISTVSPGHEYLFEVRDAKTCLALTEEEVQAFIFALYEVGFE